MKYLNLSRLFIFFFFLASCHSTEVVLRKSKAKGMNVYSQKPENKDITHTNIRQEEAKPELSKIAPLQEKMTTLLNQDLKTERKNTYTNVSEKISRHQKVNIVSSPPHIKYLTLPNTPNASTKKISKQQSNGFFGGIGRSFGVVGLVFILVGLVLFLIGGLIIDTLGAIFLAFGTVFLLIWLVLAIIQVLFDVIL
ncbi:MAG: hypothetical protein RIS63_338 [Bacteroidota bacterium]|jgi:hypothetical protein